jgi:hypothetical protein
MGPGATHVPAPGATYVPALHTSNRGHPRMAVGFVRRLAHLANGFVRRGWLRSAPNLTSLSLADLMSLLITLSKNVFSPPS